MRSMTGYSKLKFDDDVYKLSIEMKTVNNKNLNIKLKSPHTLNFLENKIRTTIANKIARGYVDIRIDFEDKSDDILASAYDSKSAKSYLALLDEMENDLGMSFNNKIELVLKNGNSLKRNDQDSDEAGYTEIIITKLNEALDSLNKTKLSEGDRLKNYFIERLDVIKENVSKLKEYKENVVELYKERLLERLNKIEADINFSKEDILREVLVFTDKSDISEEISRLDSHLISFEKELNSNKDVLGKKLDFILQEMFRELNTTGVKSNMYEISELVVASKVEVEKLREQVMNIE